MTQLNGLKPIATESRSGTNQHLTVPASRISGANSPQHFQQWVLLSLLTHKAALWLLLHSDTVVVGR